MHYCKAKIFFIKNHNMRNFKTASKFVGKKHLTSASSAGELNSKQGPIFMGRL